MVVKEEESEEEDSMDDSANPLEARRRFA